MKFIVSGRPYSTEPLDPALDTIVVDLGGIGTQPQVRDLQNFHRAAYEFFDRCSGDPDMQNAFFERVAGIAESVFFQQEIWHRGEMLLEAALQPALVWERDHTGSYIHKGTLFYFWGAGAICRGELDRGYSLMHQALLEDIRTADTRYLRLPAFAFVSLDYAKPDQAFRDWLLAQAELLKKLLARYCSSRGRTLSLDEFRTRFLLDPPSRDALSLFGYVLGRLFLFERVPQCTRQNSFAAQLEVGILFDIAMVVESAISRRNTAQGDGAFSIQAAFLAKQGHLPLDQQKLQEEVNAQFKKRFELTLQSLLDGTFVFADGSSAIGIAADLAIIYGLRNYRAHHLSSVPAIWQRFDNIVQCMFNVLFFSVEALY